MANPEYRWTQQTVLAWAAANVTGVGFPGERNHYSDTGNTYLGLVIENVTELNLAEAGRTLLRLDTLDMPSTYWEILEPTPTQKQNEKVLERAGQYLQGRMPPTPTRASTCTVQAALALHTGRVLSNAFLQLMLTTEKTGYSGCGIFNDTFAGQQAWGHRGFRAAWAYYLPTLDLYISGTNGVGGDGLDLNPLVQSVIDHGCLRLNIGDATDMAG